MGRSSLHLPLIIVAVLQIASSVWALQAGASFALIPLVITVGAISFLEPRLGLLFLVGSWFLRIPLAQTRAIYPADILLVLIAAGYVIRRLANGRWPIERTPLNIWFYLWGGTLAVSVLLSTAVSTGLVNWLHIIQVMALYFALVGFVEKEEIRRSVTVFISVCVLISIFAVERFVATGASIRVFGPSGVFFSGFLALAATFTTAAVLYCGSQGRAWIPAIALSLLIAGQIANQSRGAMLQMATGIIFVVAVTYQWSRVQGRRDVRRRIFRMAAAAIIVGVMVLLLAGHLVFPVLERYSSQSGTSWATAQMRIFLWRISLKTFTQHPIFGIGLAQEGLRSQIIPEMRFDVWYPSTRGVSAHNTMLGFLANSGIIGIVILTVLLIRALSMGRGIIAEVRDDKEAMWQVGIWGIVFVLVTRCLYEGGAFHSISGMTTMAFFAFLYRLRMPLSSRTSTGKQSSI